MAKLRLGFCTHKAASFACENYHYSRRMPSGKLVKIGVWENDSFIGCVLFGRGANNNAHKYFNCEVTECCELVRVALKAHDTPVTRIIKIALKILKKNCPGVKVIFSYADITNQGHEGIIYKAGNWQYDGIKKTGKGAYYYINGKKIHGRSARSKYGSVKNFPKNWRHCEPQEKHLFYIKI